MTCEQLHLIGEACTHHHMISGTVFLGGVFLIALYLTFGRI